MLNFLPCTIWWQVLRNNYFLKIYITMSVARCRFWKAIFFWAFRSTSLTFYFFLRCFIPVFSIMLLRIPRNKVFRCLSKHNFKSLCFHHYNITRQHENIFIIFKHVREKFIIQNRKWNKQFKRGLSHPELLRTELWSRCFDTWEVNYFTLKSLK